MITFKTKKREIGLQDGQLFVEGNPIDSIYHMKPSAHEGNGLIRAYMEAKTNLKPITDRSKLYEALRNLEADYDALRSLKNFNCTTWKLKENFQIEACTHITDKMNKILPKDLTVVEEAIINQISDEKVGRFIGTRNLINMYNVKTNSTKEIDIITSQFQNYDYEKYGIDGERMYDLYRGYALDSYKNHIEAFLMLKNDAKEDLINWSVHKISRRLNGYQLNINRWYMNSLIEDQIEVLKRKGVEKCTKPKRKSSAQKVKDKINKSGVQSLTQEELVTAFKAENGRIGYITDNMERSTLLEIVNSDLKTIQNKFSDRVNGKWNRDSSDNTTEMVKSFVRTMSDDITKSEMNTIVDFILKHNKAGYLNWQFLIDNTDRIPTKLVESYISNQSETYKVEGKITDMPDNFYNKHLKGIAPTKRLRLSTGLTYEFLRRLDTKGKIQWLEKLGESDCQISSNEFVAIYQDVAWNDIRDIINQQHRLRSLAVTLINKNKDQKLARTMLLKQGTDNYERLHCFNCFDNLEDKIDMFCDYLVREEERRTYYHSSSEYDHIEEIFANTDNGLLRLFQKMLEKFPSETNTQINDILTNRVGEPDFTDYLKVLEDNLENLLSIVITNDLTRHLPYKLKIKILENSVSLQSGGRAYYYNRHRFGVKDVEDNIKEFFADFKREDILNIYGEVYDSPYSIYLGHIMTREELESLGNASPSRFLRYNLEHFTYGYLKKYKDKKVFKDIVGDCRSPENKRFGEALLQRLDVPNSVDFFASL